MKKLFKFIIIYIFFTISILGVNAHPGRTDKNGGHTCRTNCGKYGYEYGEYHYHNSGGSSSSKTSGITTSKVPIIPVVKSNNANLSYLKVDDRLIKSASEMEFKTTNYNPEITAILQSSKASYEVVGIDKLREGLNYISINVTAENSIIKAYLLKLYIISNNAQLGSIQINNQTIQVEDQMHYSTVNDSINIKATTKHEKALIEYPENVKLSIGENNIKIKVIAEDRSTIKEYQIIVSRRKKSSETGVILKINDISILFDKSNENREVIFENGIESINIDYELADVNSTIEINKTLELKVGTNDLFFTVVAEDESIQEYKLKVERKSNSLIIVGLVLTGSTLASIIFIKSRKR